MIEMTIKIANPRDFDALRRRFQDPVIVRKAMRSAMGAAANLGYRTSLKAVKHRGLGMLPQTIFRRYTPFDAHVWTVISRTRANSIDTGRRPGEVVPVRSLIRWKDAVGYGPSARTLQQQIQLRGTKGTGFMSLARQRVRAELPSLVTKAGDRIAKKLLKG